MGPVASILDSLPNGLHDALVHELVLAPGGANVVVNVIGWSTP